MSKKIKSKNKEIISGLIIISMFLIVVGISLGLISNIKVNDSNQTNQNSDKGLTCKATLNMNANATFTWYKNAVQNTSAIINCTAGNECGTSEGLGNIPNTYTIRDDVWICSVSFNNSIEIETLNKTINIIDTPPYQPRIFYHSNGSEIFNESINIAEDVGILFNVTSWDWDEDIITYVMTLNPSFCNISSSTGILNCTPRNENEIINTTFSIGAQTSLGDTTVRLLRINITPTNDAPRFSPVLSNRNLTEGQKLNYYIIGLDDEYNYPLNLTIVNITVNNVVSNLNLTITNYINNTFMIMLRDNDTTTFAESQFNYTVNLRLSDTDNITNNSKNITGSFNLIGVNFNHPANISYIVYNNNSLRQGEALNIYINATDIDNNTLTFSVNNALYPITYNSTTNYTAVANASFAYALVNITNLTNNNVIDHTFTIFVFDTNQNSNQTINMFINNTNDNPIISEISNHTANSFDNINISKLIAYTETRFIYHVNASDPDDLTYDNQITGIRNYSTNDSAFYINITTGVLEFIPTIEGNFTFIVTVTDGADAKYNRNATIEVLLNRNPIFTVNPVIIYCNETDNNNWNYSCYYNITSNVTDEDYEDYVASFWTNSTFFNINVSTGIINFTVNQSMIGNHSILINITDSYGAINSSVMYLIINNTNNAPIMRTPNIPSGNFIVGRPYYITYYATDKDLDLININENLTYENLTFASIITGTNGTNTSIFSLERSEANTSIAILSINPLVADYEGNYSINITVTDYYGNVSNYHIFKYIYNITRPPNITQIIPSGTPINNTVDNTSWKSTSLFNNMTTTIRILENQTFIFNQTSFADNSSYINSLEYSWYYDNVLVSTQQSYQRYFNFTSNGTHNLKVIAQDRYFSNNSFTWIINVTNVNRPPTYNNRSIENLTVAGSIIIANYLTYSDMRLRFYDPDDDIAEVGYTTDNNTNLIFSSTSCSPYANLTFANKEINIQAFEIGECSVIFNARDIIDNTTISSEIILINITNITESVQEPIPVPVSSSGGGTSDNPVPIPLPIEIERPRPLQLLTPKLVTVYQNATIKIPIVINNTWNGTLLGIMLEANTSASNVSLYLDRTFIPKLDIGESVEATLYVKNYKSEGHYEIQITANVTLPEYRDVATIYINSAEMRSEGEELESKISFAKDLLSSNPECQELNELLLLAKEELANNNYATTSKMINDVLNGCKYLVNNAKATKEMPDRNFVKTFEWKKKYNDYILLGIFGTLFLISLIYIVKKDTSEEKF